MTIAELFNELEDKARDTFIVTLKYKYDFEEEYTIENQILEYDALNDDYVWLNDWREGQTDVEVLGYMPLGDVDTTKPLTGEDKHLNDMIVKYWLLNNLIGMYNDADANIRHPNANDLAKMVIKDIKNTYIDDEQANEIWNKYIKEDK